jgi:hypothetical protein
MQSPAFLALPSVVAQATTVLHLEVLSEVDQANAAWQYSFSLHNGPVWAGAGEECAHMQ